MSNALVLKLQPKKLSQLEKFISSVLDENSFDQDWSKTISKFLALMLSGYEMLNDTNQKNSKFATFDDLT